MLGRDAGSSAEDLSRAAEDLRRLCEAAERERDAAAEALRAAERDAASAGALLARGEARAAELAARPEGGGAAAEEALALVREEAGARLAELAAQEGSEADGALKLLRRSAAKRQKAFTAAEHARIFLTQQLRAGEQSRRAAGGAHDHGACPSCQRPFAEEGDYGAFVAAQNAQMRGQEESRGAKEADWRAAEARLAALEEAAPRLRRAEALRAERAAAEAALPALRSAAEAPEAAAVAARAALSAAERSLAEREACRRACEGFLQAERENARLRGALAARRAALAAPGEDLGAAVGALDALRTRLDERVAEDAAAGQELLHLRQLQHEAERRAQRLDAQAAEEDARVRAGEEAERGIEALRGERGRLEAELAGLRAEAEPLRSRLKAAEAALAAARGAEPAAAEAEKRAALAEDVAGLERLSAALEDAREGGELRAGHRAACEALAGAREREAGLEGQVGALRERLEAQRATLGDREAVRRNIEDNVKAKEAEAQCQAAERALLEAQGEAEGGEARAEEARRRVEGLRARVGRQAEARAELRGRARGYRERAEALEGRLGSAAYREVGARHRRKVIEFETTALAVGDLDNYYRALDRALMTYHSMKIAEINKIIRELWQRTYTGQDIESIQIVSGEEGRSASARSYNYRVVMKKGEATLEMKGRCSAGQRVLASIVIRLALAETFCLSTGILALDEPTTNLDEENKCGLAHALAQIIAARSRQHNFQLVCITHDIQFVDMMNQELQAQGHTTPEFYWRVQREDLGAGRYFSRIDRIDWAELND